MHLDGRLRVTAGQVSDAGAKQVNEDCMGLRVPSDPLLTTKGIAAVIADGVSSAEAGREASESCVQSFLSDYFATPDSWTVKTSSQKVLTALNRWLYARGHDYSAPHRGYVTTLSILVAKSRTAHLFHVGDTRIQRWRGGALEALTRDHATRISESDTYLTRAMGMDVRLDIDYRTEEIEAGDCFLLTTDGIHDFVDEETLRAHMTRAAEAAVDGDGLEKIGRELIDLALSAGSQDNLTCQILRIDALPPSNAEDLYRRLSELPFPPPLLPGMKIDGYRVEEEIHASSRSQLYRVREESSGRQLVMKTPSSNFEDDPAYIERFVTEPWIGSRVDSPHIVKVVPVEHGQSFLYYLQEYIEGRTLADWIRDEPEREIAAVVDILEQIAKGLRAFHRREMLHQDLKPANVLIGNDGHVRIVDFGSCFVAGIDEIAAPITRDLVLGTASYAAPELRSGRNAGVRSEIFSLGSVAYELFTGHLPYGEKIETAATPRSFERLEYVPSYHHNPMIPVWIDGALRTAVRVDPARRYGEISELLYDLKHPNAVFTSQAPVPLVERDPLLFWKGLCAGLAALYVATLWWLLG